MRPSPVATLKSTHPVATLSYIHTYIFTYCHPLPYHPLFLLCLLACCQVFEAREALSTYRFETMDEKDMTLELELDDYLDRFYHEQEEKKRGQQVSVEHGEGQGEGVPVPVLSERPRDQSSKQEGGRSPAQETRASDAQGTRASDAQETRASDAQETRASDAQGTRARPPPEEHADWRAAYRQRFDVRVHGSTVTSS